MDISDLYTVSIRPSRSNVQSKGKCYHCFKTTEINIDYIQNRPLLVQTQTVYIEPQYYFSTIIKIHFPKVQIEVPRGTFLASGSKSE